MRLSLNWPVIFAAILLALLVVPAGSALANHGPDHFATLTPTVLVTLSGSLVLPAHIFDVPTVYQPAERSPGANVICDNQHYMALQKNQDRLYGLRTSPVRLRQKCPPNSTPGSKTNLSPESAKSGPAIRPLGLC